MHIPKTGGTSTSFILDYAFQRKSIWDYEETYIKLTTEQVSFIQNGIENNMCNLYGGHVTYANYEPAIKFCNSMVMATIRDPLQHFISKFNHDFNEFSAKDKELQSLLDTYCKSDATAFTKIIAYDDMSDIFNIKNIFSNSMKDYLKAFLSVNGNITHIDYIIPIHDSERALQLFFYKWNRDFFKLQRKDPAIIKGVASNVKLNDGSMRRYSIEFSNNTKEVLKEYLNESYVTYNMLLEQYNVEVTKAEKKQFRYIQKPITQLKFI